MKPAIVTVDPEYDLRNIWKLVYLQYESGTITFLAIEAPYLEAQGT